MNRTADKRRPPLKFRMMETNNLAPDRRFFVSWDDDDLDRVGWKDTLFDKLELETRSPHFAPASQSKAADAGDVLNEWLNTKLPDAASDKPQGTRITDVIAVCSRKYLAANTDPKQANPGELQQFLKQVVKGIPTGGCQGLCVWLAPLQRGNWNNYIVETIVLGDPDEAHTHWLVRLKGDGDRYLVKGDQPGDAWEDEIYTLVTKVTGKRAAKASKPAAKKRGDDT